MRGLSSHIAVFLINVAMLALLYLQIEHVDVSEQQKKLADVLKLETLELSLDREIFRLSSRHLQNYDSVAELVRHRSERLQLLQDDAIATGDDRTALTLLASAADKAAKSDRAVDFLVRSQALLRNSEALFPLLLARLNETRNPAWFGAPLGLAINRLGRMVSAHSIKPSEESLSAIREAIEDMKQRYSDDFFFDPEGAEDFAGILEHSRIIAVETLKISKLKSDYLSLSLVPVSEQLYWHFSDNFIRQQAHAAGLFPLFHFVQAVLVVHILVLFVLVVRSNRQIAGQARALQANLEREQELNSLQRQFVLMVSHEFRTPLTIIDSVAQRFLRRPEKATPDRMKDSLTKVRSAVRGLVDLMESVLNVGKLEDGCIEVSKKSIDLRGLVSEVAGGYQQMGDGHRIKIDISRLPTTFYGDPTLLRQVISNLVSNAVKYSPAGTAITVFGTQSGRNTEICVWDGGVGIPAQELNQLFQRFYRASTSTGIAGSGIGLHLVRHLVDMHDGRIEVESEVGEGTVFTIILPLTSAETPSPERLLDEIAKSAPNETLDAPAAVDDLLDDLASDPKAA